MQNKTCLNCNLEIKGRIDKKFCDDLCRTSYNNSRNKALDLIRTINGILRRNRKILEELIHEDGKVKVSGYRLSAKGYNFMYHTHSYMINNGHTYTFCYEFGYQELDDNFYLLMREDK